MNILWLIALLPAAAGVACYPIRNHFVRRALWVIVAGAHLALSVTAFLQNSPDTMGTWIGLDALSAIFLLLTSLLFFLVTIYALGYVSREPVTPHKDYEGDSFFKNEPESVFTGSILFLLSAMTVAILSRNIALQWVAIEATTLASAPLIYFHQNRRSLEAAWKYLILCSVGIAMALLGIFFVRMAAEAGEGHLTIDWLLQDAPGLSHKWLGVAFIFMLVGYGTKMGLAPLHTWLPDAHSEAPSPVSALLSGALLNCAFMGILRLQQICVAAGMGTFGGDLLILFGLFSMVVAAVFILRQVDYKRMLAYSSVEHMGILAIGIGLGSLGLFGSFLHALNHSVSKALMFLAAGNILTRFHTKDTTKIRGLCHTLPSTGVLWVVGFLAVTGSPPFGTFVSEFTILRACLEQGRWLIAGVYVLALLVVFVGMSSIVLRMALGKSEEEAVVREPLTSIVPPAVFAVLAVILGVYLPGPIAERLHGAAQLLGGSLP
jgi:hydrogenase-4 component F